MIDLAEKEKWRGWKCKEPESCFECPFSDCIKDVKAESKNTGNTLIATFPNKAIAYYSRDEIGELAKKLGTTEEDILAIADYDGWCKGTFIVWGRTPEENREISKPCKVVQPTKEEKPKEKGLGKRTEVVLYWPDGRSKKFSTVREAANHLGVKVDTIYYRLCSGKATKGCLIQKACDPPPTAESFWRKKWSKGLDTEILPVPDYRIVDPFKYIVLFDDGSVNEYYTLRGLYTHIRRFLDYSYDTFLRHYNRGDCIKCIRQITTKGKNKVNITSRGTVIGIWPTGEKIHFMSAFDASRALHVAEHTIWKYVAMEQPYRGVIFRDGGILL